MNSRCIGADADNTRKALCIRQGAGSDVFSRMRVTFYAHWFTMHCDNLTYGVGCFGDKCDFHGVAFLVFGTALCCTMKKSVTDLVTMQQSLLHYFLGVYPMFLLLFTLHFLHMHCTCISCNCTFCMCMHLCTCAILHKKQANLHEMHISLKRCAKVQLLVGAVQGLNCGLMTRWLVTLGKPDV